MLYLTSYYTMMTLSSHHSTIDTDFSVWQVPRAMGRGRYQDSIRWYHWYPLMNGLFILMLALVYLIWHQAVVARQGL